VHSALPKTAHRGPVPRGTGGLGAAGVPAHSLLEGRQPRDEYRRLPRLGRRPEGRRERGQGRHGGVRRDQGPGARGPPRPALEKRTGQREFGRYVMRELVLSFSRIITVTVNNKCHPLAIHKEPVTFFLSISKLQRYGAATILVNNIQVSSQSRITRHPPPSLSPPSLNFPLSGKFDPAAGLAQSGIAGTGPPEPPEESSNAQNASGQPTPTSATSPQSAATTPPDGKKDEPGEKAKVGPAAPEDSESAESGGAVPPVPSKEVETTDAESTEAQQQEPEKMEVEAKESEEADSKTKLDGDESEAKEKKDKVRVNYPLIVTLSRCNVRNNSKYALTYG
jgi:hypothetical protein